MYAKRRPIYQSALLFILFLLLPAIFSRPTCSPTLTLVFVGDVMLGRGVATALDGDWPAAFAQVRPWLAEADLSFANLESPLTTAPFVGGRFDLRAPPDAVRALDAAGLDMVSLVNNHALDGGEIGLEQTLLALEQANIKPLLDPAMGGLVTAQPIAQSPLPIFIFALLDDGGSIDATSISQVAAPYNFVIVNIHWGAEYQFVAKRQRALAHQLAAAGADLIVGHGPHVLQPIEWVDGALVAYSLGNFLFDQPFPETQQGAALRLTLDEGHISAVEALPTVIKEGRVYPASGQDAVEILNRLQILVWP